MTVQIYHNTDPSAPVITMGAGVFITFLDAVLVNGYGDKPGAGWTKTYSGTNIAVYRNNATTGTGMYLWVNDTQSQYAQVRVMKTITDNVAGAGTDVAPIQGQNGIPCLYWYKGISASAKRWSVIADDRTAYINGSFYNTASPDYWGSYGTLVYIVGDYVSYLENDQHNYLITGSYTTSLSSQYTPLFTPNPSGTTYQIYLGRTTSNAVDMNTGATFWTGASSNRPAIDAYTGAKLAIPYHIIEQRISPAFRGHFRGAYYPLYRIPNAWVQNQGKLENDPFGPDVYAMNENGNLSTANNYWATSILVKGGDWE